MPADISKLIDQLRKKYPEQLKKEPLLDDIEEMSYEDEDMEEEMPMDDELGLGMDYEDELDDEDFEDDEEELDI